MVPRFRLSSLLTSDSLPVSLSRASNSGYNRFRRAPRRSNGSYAENVLASAGWFDSDAVEPRRLFNATLLPRELTDAGSTAILGATGPRTSEVSLGKDSDRRGASAACHGPPTGTKRRASKPWRRLSIDEFPRAACTRSRKLLATELVFTAPVSSVSMAPCSSLLACGGVEHIKKHKREIKSHSLFSPGPSVCGMRETVK